MMAHGLGYEGSALKKRLRNWTKSGGMLRGLSSQCGRMHEVQQGGCCSA
jgi:hypothetical protein